MKILPLAFLHNWCLSPLMSQILLQLLKEDFFGLNRVSSFTPVSFAYSTLCMSFVVLSTI